MGEGMCDTLLDLHCYTFSPEDKRHLFEKFADANSH